MFLLLLFYFLRLILCYRKFIILFQAALALSLSF